MVSKGFLIGLWNLIYAGIELGPSLTVLDENIGAFDSTRGSLDLSGNIAIRKCRFRQTSDESQFTDARLGRCIRSNVNRVGSGTDDIVLCL